ncbi:MAG: SDR family NAD(P)-dependent oxidoreductase [Proteobacteria bacterium]|nr:SDR family NAD(P)-dependent oxidoreductase [Pseudomonadota bacterium]
MQDLKNRVAVVTGGASGIGRGICRALAQEGAKVVVADVEVDRALSVASELCANGAEAIAVGCDVTVRTDVEALADKAFEAFGAVNIICNNAGVGIQGKTHTFSEGDWDWVMAVNVKAIYYTVAAFLPRMIASGEPMHIQSTASEHGLGPPELGRCSVYTASKHAVVGLSEMLRRENQRHGLEVSILCPGIVSTDIYDGDRNRDEARFGEGLRVSKEHGDRFMGDAMDPNAAGRIAVDGIKDGDFFITTHPYIRKFAETRTAEVAKALDNTDKRILSEEQQGRQYFSC